MRFGSINFSAKILPQREVNRVCGETDSNKIHRALAPQALGGKADFREPDHILVAVTRDVFAARAAQR
jgi:hypothetical protein